METLNEYDLELIEKSKEIIVKNYDRIKFNHTVASAVRCSNGKVFLGINVYSIHGACGEQVALGSAIANGERIFETIVAVRGEMGEEVIPPCGNCRQMLVDYCPDCYVIINTENGLRKIKARNLLPFSYNQE